MHQKMDKCSNITTTKNPKRRKTSVKIEYLTETIGSSLQKNSIVAANTKGSANVSVFPKDNLSH